MFNKNARRNQLRVLNNAQLQEMLVWYDEPEQKDNSHLQADRAICVEVIQERNVGKLLAALND